MMSIFRSFLRRALPGNVATKPPAGAASTMSRGWAAVEAGQWAEAQRLADAVIDGAPQEDGVEAQAYLLRGLARSNRRDFDGALADYEVVLQIQPDSVPCRVNQSAVLHTLGRFEEALNAAERALALDPGHPVAHNNRGLMLRELGRLEEAEGALRRALQCDARYHDAIVTTGRRSERRFWVCFRTFQEGITGGTQARSEAVSR